jgi:adenylate cyclase
MARMLLSHRNRPTAGHGADNTGVAEDLSRDEDANAHWAEFLEHPDTMYQRARHVLRRIPSNPRCRLCAAPFQGPGAPVMRLIGKGPSDANPNYCNTCANILVKHRGGAEVEASVLFADIRGSTSLAEKMSPTAFKQLLDRFYTMASNLVFANEGMVDKFVGDELVASYPPNLGESSHAARAIATARQLLEATGHGDPDGPWAPVGAGVHTGRIWFGAVGDGAHIELTVVGDDVNVAARLAARAEAGEILVSAAAAEMAGLDADLERRALELKGKEQPVEVVSLRIGPPVERAGGGAS